MVRSIAPNFVCYKMEDYADYKEYGTMGCGNAFGYFYMISF
jgi:hypothetical protein